VFGWSVFAALAVLLPAGLLLRKAGRIKQRHLRFVRGVQESAGEHQVDPNEEHLIDGTRALYHGTRFADGTALLIPAWRDACVCDLWCTAYALFVQREGQGALLSIPLTSIDEAALHRAHAPLAAKELPMLRLRWTRGGEKLETDLSLRGGMASLESLRREIHLRQGNIAAQLRPFLEKQP
jgi:hypothetical protein